MQPGRDPGLSVHAVQGTAVSRLRQRLFQPWSQAGREAAARAAGTGSLAPVPIPKKSIGFQASIAEFLLVNRLRARRRSEKSPDVLERAARIVFVTCQNWFAEPERDNVRHRTRL